jgi:hypothetical protein
MSNSIFRVSGLMLTALCLGTSVYGKPVIQGKNIKLSPEMLTNETKFGNPQAMVDEQNVESDPPIFMPKTAWNVPKWKVPKSKVKEIKSFSAYIDLGKEKDICRIMFYDGKGRGSITVSSGEPGNWKPLLTEPGDRYRMWKRHDVLVRTRYLRLTLAFPVWGEIREILVYEATPEEMGKVKSYNKRKAGANEAAKSRKLVDAGEGYGKLPLITEVLPAEIDSGDNFNQYPKKASRVKTILGEKMRVMPPTKKASHFAYKIGGFSAMKSGKTYMLTVEFPEKQPRSFAILNRGADLFRGIHSGKALGDVIYTYTDNNLESLDIPLSGKILTWRQTFELGENFCGLKNVNGAKKKSDRPDDPESGFWVIFSQPEGKSLPISKGIAVYRIRLFEVPNPAKLHVKLNLPPKELPHRNIFFREEMGDASVNSQIPNGNIFNNVTDWYRSKCEMMKRLGMNTYTKDLLEFGHVQHWDAENPAWFNLSKDPTRWGKILKVLGEYGFDVLPYYEYSGPTAGNSFARLRKCEPLRDKDEKFTHIGWCEAFSADLTSPETIRDFKRVLDMTIIRHKDKVHFVGAWLRARPTSMPISFAEATRKRFADQANGGKMVSRENLQNDKTLLNKYYKWWFGKRKEFFKIMRDYLQEKGVKNATIFFTAASQEPGPSLPRQKGQSSRKAVVTDDMKLWNEIKTRKDHVAVGAKKWQKLWPRPYKEIANNTDWLKANINKTKTWSFWEWQHSVPQADPQNYKDTSDIMLVYPFHRLFTVSNPDNFTAFTNKSGLATVRHFPLNEHTRGNLLGYFVCDYDRTGPYSMLAEARAVAYGDPWYLGNQAGHNYSRGFPFYTREFNRNFLALPALKSKIIANVANDKNVVVREINAGSHGKYYAIVNVGLKPIKSVKIKLPASGKIIDAADNKEIGSGKNLTLNLYPGQLRSLLVK